MGKSAGETPRMDEVNQFVRMGHDSFIHMSSTPHWMMTVEVSCHYKCRRCGGSVAAFADCCLYCSKGGLDTLHVIDVVHVDRWYIHGKDQHLSLLVPDFDRSDVWMVAWADVEVRVLT